MTGRERTAKARARRIDRGYFQRVFALQRWRWTLGTAGVALCAAWLGMHFATGSSTPYSAGPLTHPHAMLNRNCAACHVRTGSFTSAVSDRTCSGCHDGSLHNARQTLTPECTACHLEHTGRGLTDVDDKQCATCHADLKVKSGGDGVAANVTSFRSDHPEFAVLRLKTPDPGTITFNHGAHMGKTLRTPGGDVKLACSNCHQTGDNRKFMDPVGYYPHCSNCHPLAFDQRFAEPAPHKSHEIVHNFLVQKFSAWVAAHPEELHATRISDIRVPGVRPQPAASPAAWVAARVADSEKLLRIRTCKECHQQATVDAGLPPVAPAKLTPRWFKHGEFDHSAHQMVQCESCHAQASKSRLTSDVLLPGIAVCRSCHISGKQDAAGANCIECHVYHDPANRKPVEGRFTVEQLSASHL